MFTQKIQHTERREKLLSCLFSGGGICARRDRVRAAAATAINESAVDLHFKFN